MLKNFELALAEGKFILFRLKGHEFFFSESEFQELANTVHMHTKAFDAENTESPLPIKPEEELSAKVINVDDLPTLNEVEKRYILLLSNIFNEKDRVAKILGVDRTTLYRKRKEYKID